MNSPGFFLIQSLVYCVVLAFCCALLFTYAARTNISLSHINGYAHDYGMLLAAHDVCVRDIQAGKADATKWYEAVAEQAVWRVCDEDRGWWSNITICRQANVVKTVKTANTTTEKFINIIRGQ